MGRTSPPPACENRARHARPLRREIFVGATHGSPFSAAGMLKQGEACRAPTKRDIRRGVPWVAHSRRRHEETAECIPPAYEERDIRRGDPWSPFSTDGMLKQSEACR